MTGKRRKLYPILTALSIYILGVILYSVFSFVRAQNTFREDVDKLITAGALGTVNLLPDDFHDRATNKDSITDREDYRNIIVLSNFAKNLNIAFTYTVIEKDGNLYFSSVGATDEELKNNSYVKCFTLYDDAPPELKSVFKTKEKSFAEYSDKWGSFRSVFIPMKSPGGNFYAACADIRLDDLNSHLAGILFQSILGAGIFILLGLPILWVFKNIASEQGSLLNEKQSQLAHASRLTSLGEMAAGIAHEINQPLCVLRGYLELMQSALKNNPILKEKQLENSFDICIKSVEKVSNIIKHMRSFVRSKSAEVKPLNLADPINEALAFFNEQIRLHNIQLTKTFQEGIPQVRIDSQRFEQVVVNFISNARYAVDKKGEKLGRSFQKIIEISIAHDAKKDEVIFAIQDNGIGMSGNVLKHCRDPFYTTKAEGEGTGLGLSIVQGILDDVNGKMEINTKEGVGCTIKVIFPAVREAK
ncbi:MAG: hypothetical protein A2017_11115 [Lentisphaerae bacterium GWF2_44_16]|nr:MAG: hypothetical protein A2017_11115 [Lentisphaerae bacterium GWF2_44_16]